VTTSFDHFPEFAGPEVAEFVVVGGMTLPDLNCCPVVGRVMRLTDLSTEFERLETADLTQVRLAADRIGFPV